VVLGACASSDLVSPAPSKQSATSAASAKASPAERPTELTPKARELLDRLAPNLSRSSRGLHWVAVHGGVRSMDLQGRFAHATLAVRGADGVVRSVCVESADGAEAAARRAEGLSR